MAACQTAQVGWLVDFTSSSISDHFPREGKEPEPPEKCLVKKEWLPELKAQTVQTIKSAAANGGLISHPQLPYILFQWGAFAEDDNAMVKAWTSDQLKTGEAVSKLARAFTGESWSHAFGMFGLGDRVAMRKVRASVDGLERIVDVGEFRCRLEEIERESTVDAEVKESVLVFLEAWRKREAGEDRL